MTKLGSDILDVVTFDSAAKVAFWHIFAHFPMIERVADFRSEVGFKVFEITKSIMDRREQLGIDAGDFITRLQGIRYKRFH